ncbi:hypothetical protein P7C70_g7449, partial [Phenoliferia sp. Uapishka_3]
MRTPTSLGLALATLATLTSGQRTDEASAAAIKDPALECAPYALPAVTALQAAGAFPSIWQIANMSKANADDLALFTSLNVSIPAIAPRGTPTGNFTGGPNCSHNAYYDYLLSVNQKATLFYIGSNVLGSSSYPFSLLTHLANQPLLFRLAVSSPLRLPCQSQLKWSSWSLRLEAQRGLDDGHEICAHTWSHRYMTSLTNEQVFAELYYSKKAIKDVLGITVACWRPPYGDVDDRVRYIAQALGMATVIWADNTFDYLIATTNKTYVDHNYDAILAKQAAGGYSTEGTIVLSHELNNFTMQESEQYLPKIQAAFAHVAPIAVCNNNTNPYAEAGYTYPNFDQWVAGTRTMPRASATAVSVAAVLSLPLQSGVTSSVFFTNAYAEGAATVGAGAAGTTLGGSGAGVTGAVATGPSSAGSASQSAKATGTSGARREVGSMASFVGLAVAAGGVMVGGMLL